MRPSIGSLRPMLARISTVTTKALEIGLESVRPREMPLTMTNR